MSTVRFYCRGKCRDYTPHVILDSAKGENNDFTKIQCVHEDAEPFVIEHDKGKPATEHSRRVELANPEE